MMNIRIISVGSIKEKYLLDLINEYKKRLQKFVTIEEIELKDESNKLDTELVKSLETKKIINYLNDGSYKILLDIHGTMLTSEELAKKIDEDGTFGRSSISFIIGGSCGVSDEIYKHIDYRLSFSKMTFPHQLMKGILLEQVYRSYTILNNIKYHK